MKLITISRREKGQIPFGLAPPAIAGKGLDQSSLHRFEGHWAKLGATGWLAAPSVPGPDPDPPLHWQASAFRGDAAPLRQAQGRKPALPPVAIHEPTSRRPEFGYACQHKDESGSE